MVLTPRICCCCVDAATARAMGLAEALRAVTKVLRAGALSCLVKGERRALEKVREFDLDVRLVSYGAPSREMAHIAADFGR